MAQFNRDFEKQGVKVRLEEAYSELGYVEEGIKLVQHDLLIGERRPLGGASHGRRGLPRISRADYIDRLC